MALSLDVAVQMDPLEHVDINGDSTFALMLEAQARGHRLFVYEVPTLALEEGAADRGAAAMQVSASVRLVTLRREKGNHASFGEAIRRNLGGMDVILMRQDPPFDMAYITATHLLDHVHGTGPGRALVVNDPRWVRDSPEKLLVTHFPQLMPPTLVTWDIGQIRAFRAKWRDIIVKPLFGNGGSGIFRIREDDQNLNALLEMHFVRSREPLMIQRYESAVKEGDKRIILVNGEPVGAINRVPSAEDHRSNMHVGGVAHKIGLTERDREICSTIGPFLKEHGLLFVGIDVIGNYLTEINVTSPTGLQELARFDGVNAAALIWDCIEAKLEAESGER
ncbi:glutathione synthase [Acetobacter thailandicus]|uniref:Glutathione synthetase n=1 Tax=Acetobacter thailandicus TaxID=1502842 RepID=A0ABT3QAX1_9PROT|nr:glutathione synthase [Acetobacter thailandicus]MCX2562431.1 glutathione synthase [Acetobacter thailandicus]NHN94497.1 glutathione synthase [Acetobacter thailandicus]